MVAIVAILFLTGVMVGIIAALGAGLFALFVGPVGIAVAIRLALAARTGTAPRPVASRESSQASLGAGGPADPAS